MTTPTTPSQATHAAQDTRAAQATQAAQDTQAAQATTPAEASMAGSGSAAENGTATITVRLFAGAAAEYGSDTALVRGSTVAEAIADLTSGASPQAATAIERSSLLVNAVSCTDHSRSLKDGDRIDVLPPFAGG